jgi:hypothetical protein
LVGAGPILRHFKGDPAGGAHPWSTWRFSMSTPHAMTASALVRLPETGPPELLYLLFHGVGSQAEAMAPLAVGAVPERARPLRRGRR